MTGEKHSICDETTFTISRYTIDHFKVVKSCHQSNAIHYGYWGTSSHLSRQLVKEWYLHRPVNIDCIENHNACNKQWCSSSALQFSKYFLKTKFNHKWYEHQLLFFVHILRNHLVIRFKVMVNHFSTYSKFKLLGTEQKNISCFRN